MLLKIIIFPFLDKIRKSVWQSKKLIILYGKHEMESSKRIVHPYGMVVKNLEWYLTAYCEQSQEVRILKCERIKEAKLLEEAFTIPNSFSLKQFWKENEKSFKRSRKAAERYPVTIKLHNYDRDMMRDYE